MEKPKNWRDYIGWWNENFDDRIGLSSRKLYDDISAKVKYSFDHSNEFMALIHQLHNYESEYKRSFGYNLLMKKPEEINLEIKEWDRFILKVWRKNVVLNINWKDENWDKERCKPDGGWITPSNWFEEIHDIVRTRIVVKYFDGVELLLNKMCVHFSSHNCQILSELGSKRRRLLCSTS